MWRKVFLLLLAFTFTFSSFASAAIQDNGGNVSPPKTVSLAGFSCGGAFFSEEVNEDVTKFKEEDANMGEKFLTGQLQNLWNIGDVNGLSTLVFGNPYCVWADGAFKDESKIKMAPDGIFTLEERKKIIDPILKMFSGAYVLLLALALMFSGLKLQFNSVRGRGLAELGEDVKFWFLSLLFIAGYSTITNLIFELNAGVVLSFKALLESNGVKVDSFSIMASWTDLIKGGGGVLSAIIVVLGEWILALVLNFVYIARKVIILVLLALGFVAGYSLLFSRSRAFFGTWMKELLGNVFLQSIHALLLFGMAMFASLGASPIYKLGLMMMFLPITGMISKWLNIGDSSSKVGGAMTMAGLGGVMSTMMLTNQAGNILRGGSMHGGNMQGGNMSNSSNSQNNSGGFFGNTSLSEAGGALDSSITSISTDASGVNSSGYMNTKNVLSNVGGAVFGAAGLVLGPAGAVAGAKVGQAVTSTMIQGPRNIASGIKSTMSTVQGAQNFVGSGGQVGFKAMMGDVGQRREFFGNLGESVGAMAGMGGVGRKVGLAMSGVSKQRLLSTPTSQGGRGMLGADGKLNPPSFESIAKQYPGAEMRYIQTNKGSSMYVKPPNADWNSAIPVGTPGAADPSIPNGQARMMNYELAKSSGGYEYQSNGTYKAQTMSASGQPENKVVGLQGSTPNVMRTSEAYLVGVGGNGAINASTVATATSATQQYQDPTFKGANINPDAFVSHNIPGVNNRTTSDKVADSVHSVSKVASSVGRSWKNTADQSGVKRLKKLS